MRVRMDDLIRERQAAGGAVGALTCYDFSTALAVVDAAEELGRGVILLVTPKTAADRHGPRFLTALRALADGSAVPVSVQLDHATDLALILRSVEAGADAVLADGSALPFEENAAFTAEAVRRSGVVVEAELGALAGDEDRALASLPSGRTDAALVAPFLSAAGAHVLATSVGNVHGTYAAEPELDWPLIDAIHAASGVPLSLHGASGIPEADLRRAVGAGLGKININTELRAAVLDAAAQQLPDSRAAGDDVLSLERTWRSAASAFAREAMLRLDSAA
ncbi:fructose-bisphosphate aldolase [Rathayibacter caricis DSM 15933]|uniref:Fructose-bisphosphate aldolase n=2 Tax=Microbacteriaceae TaxID=85023 RepID=A0A2T4UPI0_9MICO|nr:fructose-bisphosphate aldolase [Rathayibacter caricis DSM 15933]